MNGNCDAISINEGSTLTLYDVNQNTGVITHAEGKSGRGVLIYGGTFTMNGGSGSSAGSNWMWAVPIALAILCIIADCWYYSSHRAQNRIQRRGTAPRQEGSQKVRMASRGNAPSCPST